MASCLARVAPIRIPCSFPDDLNHDAVRTFLGTSQVTESDRQTILGSRCGTPRRSRVPMVQLSVDVTFDVTFESDDAAAEKTVSVRGTRQLFLGSTSGTPRGSQPLVSFDSDAMETGIELLDHTLARAEVLGTRCGTPRKQRSALVTFSAQNQGPPTCSSNLDRASVLGSRAGTPRRSRTVTTWADAEVKDGADDVIPGARSARLGTRHGTPKKGGQSLLRASSGGAILKTQKSARQGQI